MKDQRFRREWKVGTDGYAYTVSEDRDLSSELFSWHWHPTTRQDTHLHVGRGHDLHGPLARLRVPTGRVAFEEVVRFLIEDLYVQPERSDWDSVLSECLERFRRFRTWPSPQRPVVE